MNERTDGRTDRQTNRRLGGRRRRTKKKPGGSGISRHKLNRRFAFDRRTPIGSSGRGLVQCAKKLAHGIVAAIVIEELVVIVTIVVVVVVVVVAVAAVITDVMVLFGVRGHGFGAGPLGAFGGGRGVEARNLHRHGGRVGLVRDPIDPFEFETAVAGGGGGGMNLRIPFESLFETRKVIDQTFHIVFAIVIADVAIAAVVAVRTITVAITVAITVIIAVT